jgi:hypothetical protein
VGDRLLGESDRGAGGQDGQYGEQSLHGVVSLLVSVGRR